MGNAETVVIPVKLGLTGLGVRLCRVPGLDLGWSEDEWSPVVGDGSDRFSIPWLGSFPDSLTDFLLVFVGSASPPAST